MIGRKKIPLVIAALAAVPIAGYLFFLRREAPASPPELTESSRSHTAVSDIALPVVGSLAIKSDLAKSIDASGTIRGERDVDIVAHVSGTIDSVRVTNGALVRKGALLARLDPREFQIALEKARTALVSAQIEYRSQIDAPAFATFDSSNTRERFNELRTKAKTLEEEYRASRITEDEYRSRKRDLTAQETYFNARRGDVIATKSGLSPALEEFSRAQLNLEWTDIRAPFDGAVANCTLVPHLSVNAGMTLLKLVDVHRLVVDVQVLESDAGRIHKGSPADIRVTAYPRKTFRGQVSAINPYVDPKSRTLLTTVRIFTETSPGALELRSGMYAHVNLESEKLFGRILVPVPAVLVRDQRSLVFVAQHGLAKWVYVDVGERNDAMVEILSGVSPGDTVLVDGHYTLAHDAPIAVRMAN
jgi:membrane fusion protein, multidrug efflux system